MSPVNLNDNIHAHGRHLHLQTETHHDSNTISSTLYDGGRVLVKEEQDYSMLLSDEELQELVLSLHGIKLLSIERLFSISARIQTVKHATSLHRLGRQFLRWHLLDEAISDLTLAIQYNKQLGHAYVDLSEAYILRGALEEAESTIKKGLSLLTEYPDLNHQLGRIYMIQKNYIPAIEAFIKALKINNKYAAVHGTLAQCFLEIVLNPSEEVALPAKEESIRRAKDHLQRAVALSRQYQNAQTEESMRLLFKGQTEEAHKLLIDFLQSNNPRTEYAIQDEFYLSFLYGEQGRDRKRVSEYIDRLERSIADHASQADYHNHLGIVYIIQCRNLFNLALSHFRKAIGINPEYKTAAKNLKLADNEGKGLLLLLRALLK